MKSFVMVLFFFCTLAAATEKLALVIGNNNGLASEVPLRYAQKDASRIAELLTTLGGFKKDRMYLLINQSVATLQSTVKELVETTKKLRHHNENIILFVYYSGHGSGNAFHINGQKYQVDSLRSFFGAATADLKILVADACNSGAILRPKGGSLSRPIVVTVEDCLSVKGSVIISSSSEYESSHESSVLKGSVFSSHLVSALRGAADYDGDGRISLWESLTYARNRTSSTVSAKRIKQTPGYDIKLSGEQSVYLSHLNRSAASLRITDCEGGEYEFIDASSSTLSASVSAEKGDTLFIAVPRGIWIVRLHRHKAHFAARIDLSWGGHKTVSNSMFRQLPPDYFREKGGRSLFNNYRIGLSYSLMRSATTDFWRLPELSLSYRLKNGRIAGFFAYTLGETPATEVTIPYSLFNYGIAYFRYLFNRTVFSLSAGIRYDYFNLSQKPEWKDEFADINRNAPSLPVYSAHLSGCSLPLECSLLMPSGFSASLSIASCLLGGKRYPGELFYKIVPRGTLTAGYSF
jgi:hypothetical protein